MDTDFAVLEVILLLAFTFETQIQCSDTCRSDEFQCYDGRCISVDKIHDMTVDCEDESDEYDCDYLNIRCLQRHRLSGGPEDECRRITKDGKTCSTECKVIEGNRYVCEQNNTRQYCHQSFYDIKSSIKPLSCDFKTSFCGWTIRSNASVKSWTSEDEGRVIAIVARNLSRTVLTSPSYRIGSYPLSIRYTVQKSASSVWSIDIPRSFYSMGTPKWQTEECFSCERQLMTDKKVNLIIWTYGVGEYNIKVALHSAKYQRHLFRNIKNVCGQSAVFCDGNCVHPSIINDGIRDCDNRKDEYGKHPCNVIEKQCKSGKCIPTSFPSSLLTQCSENEEFPFQKTTNECPSDYLCKQKNIFSDPICLKKEQLCDGIPQCPHWDDENKCPIRDCPVTCNCSSNTYKCHPEAISKIPSHAHFIDISNYKTNINEICSLNRMALVYLNISRSGITDISCVVANNSFPNLKTLDASFNNITSVPFIFRYGEGRSFIFDENPINTISFESRAIYNISMKKSGINKIHFRKVQDTHLGVYNTIFVNMHPRNYIYDNWNGHSCFIKDINLSFNKIESVDFLRGCLSLEYVDLSWNSVTKLDLREFIPEFDSVFPPPSLYYLIYLNLNNNKIREIESGGFEYLRNLKKLDLGHNRLKTIPLDTFDRLTRVEEIYLENNQLHNVDFRLFKNLRTLNVLDISYNGIKYIPKKTFPNMLLLAKLNIKGNNIAMYKDIYYGLSVLQELTVDKYSLCCVRPRSVTIEKCFSPKLTISSCQYLLRHGVLGVSIWFVTVFILICCAVLTYRHFKGRHQNGNRSRNILLHISIADFLFGICLFTIGTKDVESKGVYGLSHDKWIRSIWCDIIRLISFLCIGFTTLFSVSASLNISSTLTRQRIVLPFLWIGSLFITVVSFALNKFVITDSSALHHICLMIPLSYRNSTSDTWNLILTCFHTTCVVAVLVSECFKLFRRKKSCHMRCNNNVIDLLVFGISFRNVFLCIKGKSWKQVQSSRNDL